MKDYRILNASETGRGILIEMDAGWVSPSDPKNVDILREQKELDYRNPFEFYAVLQKYGVPNRNGRVYPEKILKRESEKYKTAIKKGLSTSELNHPESSLIDLDRVSHLITDIWWDGNILMGKLKLLTSPGFHEKGIVSTKGDIAANTAKVVNQLITEKIGTNEAARITCIKPSGTTSLVLGTASGIHAWHNDYYLRTMRFNKNEDVAVYLMDKHPELCEDDVLRPTDTVCVRIPVKAPDTE